METKKNTENICTECVNGKGLFKRLTGYTRCPEFNRYTSQIRGIWERYLGNYNTTYTKDTFNSPFGFTVSVTVDLLDDNFNPLTKEDGNQSWEEATKNFKKAVHEELDFSDSCFGCRILTNLEKETPGDDNDNGYNTIELQLSLYK